MSNKNENKKITEEDIKKAFKDAVDKAVENGIPESAKGLIEFLEAVNSSESNLEALRKEIIKHYGK